MKTNVESYELSLWSKQDEFLTLLRAPEGEFEGQAYNVKLIENINGMKTLEFSVPMYIFDSILGEIIENSRWRDVLNERKVRLKISPNTINEKIYEFILKTFTESRSGLEKIANCVCQDYAIFELSKIGWGISLSEDTISNKEIDDFSENVDSKIMTIDYWLEKLLYEKTKLGRVQLSPNENATDLLYLARALTPRDIDGNSVASIDPETNLPYDPIQLTPEMKSTYQNETGWTWVINTPDNKLYEEIGPADYQQVSPDVWEPVNYQENYLLDPIAPSQLRWYPMTGDDIVAGWEYTLEEKKRIIKNERSNIYNILQTLAEKYEFWFVLQYTYNSIGQIIGRTIIIENEVIEENNTFEIRFGVNLSNISRTIESDSITTKLFVPPINSTSIEGRTISISDTGANYMREMYLLNFEHYFTAGLLTDADRVVINAFQLRIRNLNLSIEGKQNEILPLTYRLDQLNEELDVEEASIKAYDEEIADLQAKLNVINIEDLVIESWDEESTSFGYIGEYKTVPNNSIINMNKNGIIGEFPINFSTIAGETIVNYPPRYFNKTDWNSEDAPLTDADFTLIDNEDLIYSNEPGAEDIIIGFHTGNIVPPNDDNSIRIRYKYIPYYWYYKLQLNLINKRNEASNVVDDLNIKIAEINNVITGLLTIKQQELDVLLREKNSIVQLFERDYNYFIKEGQWEDNSYNTYTKSINSKGDFWTITPSNPIALTNYIPPGEAYGYKFYITFPLETDLSTLTIQTLNGGGMTFIQDVNFFYGEAVGIGPCFIFLAGLEAPDDIGAIIEGTEVNISFTNLQTGSVLNTTSEFLLADANTYIIPTKTAEIVDPDFIYDTLQIFYTENDFELTPYEDFEYKLDTVFSGSGPGPDTYYNVIKITFKTTNNCYHYDPLYQNNFYIKYKQDITSKFFYRDAELTIKNASIPDVSYSIDIVNIAGMPGNENFKPRTGMLVPIYDREMLFNGLQGFITEISSVFDNPEESTIAISSYKNKFADLFQRIVETTNTIQYNEESLLRAAAAFENDGSINTATWYQSFLMNKVDIPLGTTNEVLINSDGITLVDTSKLINGVSPLIRLIGQGIYLSNEEELVTHERIWRTGITANGINASVVNSGNLNVKNLMIWNEDQYRFLWDADGIKAYGDFLNGEIDYNKYVKLSDKGLKFVYKQNYTEIAKVSLDWDGLLISSQNGSVVLNGNDGLLVNDLVGGERIQLGKLSGAEDLYGLRLRNSDGNSVMETDTYGDLWLSRFIRVGGNTPSQAITGIYGGMESQYQYYKEDPVTKENLERGFIRFWAGEGINYSFIELEEQLIMPTSTPTKIDISTDNHLIAVSHSGYPFLTLYERNLNGYIILPDQSYLPSDIANGVAFSSEAVSNYLAVASKSSPYLIIYSRTGPIPIPIAENLPPELPVVPPSEPPVEVAPIIPVEEEPPAIPEPVIGPITASSTDMNLKNYGVIGNDSTDDTAKIQLAINNLAAGGGGTAYFPDGIYLMDPMIGIFPKNGVKLKLSANATLKAKPVSSEAYNIVRFYKVNNSGIDGGMILGERNQHLGTGGEHGYGVSITCSSNIRVSNIHVANCWGDGIVVGGYQSPYYSQNILIENFICDNNRRQGISVISVRGMTIRNGILSNTNGTDPQAGIDFEPDLIQQFIQGVLMEDVQIFNNAGWGMDWWFYKLIGSGNMVTIVINRCPCAGNVKGGVRYGTGFTTSNSHYNYLDIKLDGVQIGKR